MSFLDRPLLVLKELKHSAPHNIAKH